MKIGIISHSPAWTTGFGVTCNKIVSALAHFNYSVACFSVGELGKSYGQENYPFKIWTINDAIDGTTTIAKLINAFSIFLDEEKPDSLLINFDISTTVRCIKICNELSWTKKIFAHIVINGFPVNKNELEVIKKLDYIIVPTKASLIYLKSEGIENVTYSPHGVDMAEFRSFENKQILRSKLAFNKNLDKAYIIGVFANNEERKQIPKILLALKHLIYTRKINNIYIYLHTQVKPEPGKGWDLQFIINYLKLGHRVILPPIDFKQDNGIQKNVYCEEVEFKPLNYIERINICDLIINIPFCGGFELSNIEAQSCGIPLITINDKGNIIEVVGKSALIIEPKLRNIWQSGAFIYLVDEKELAFKIEKIMRSKEMQKSLKHKGIKNAKRFPWSYLQKAVGQLFDL